MICISYKNIFIWNNPSIMYNLYVINPHFSHRQLYGNWYDQRCYYSWSGIQCLLSSIHSLYLVIYIYYTKVPFSWSYSNNTTSESVTYKSITVHFFITQVTQLFDLCLFTTLLTNNPIFIPLSTVMLLIYDLNISRQIMYTSLTS